MWLHKGLSWHQSLFYSLFGYGKTTSAGLQTIDVTTLSDPTNIIMGILMFIGSYAKLGWWRYSYNNFRYFSFLINFSNNADKHSVKASMRSMHIYGYSTFIAGDIFTMATIFNIFRNANYISY